LEGTRGQGYVRRGKLWRLDSESDDREANRRVVVIAIIEDVEGVENIESILDVQGLTGFALGVADLAASMGNLPLNDPRVATALDTVKQAIKRRGDQRILDLVVDPSDAGRLASSGSQLLMFNHDVILIGDYFESLAQKAKRSIAGA
jgi:2-keto-3-deoxy-L-rhamnonate aldolase RhmA